MSFSSGFDDNVSELLGIDQAAQRIDRVIEGDALGDGRLAYAPGCDLNVLFAQGFHHVVGNHVARGQFFRVQPDAHAVIAAAQEGHVAHAVQPGKDVLYVGGGVVAQVELVAAIVGRDQIHAQQDAGRTLFGGYALAPDLLGQLGLGYGHAVLHEHLGHVQVGPQFECDG